MGIDPIPPVDPTSPEFTNYVSAGLRIKGEVSGNEDLLVDGSIEGSIRLQDRKLTVGLGGKVTADVVARQVVVYGSSEGKVCAEDRIEIKKDSSVVGELKTTRILIEDGAYFRGSIEIQRKAAETVPDLDTPTFARAATATGQASPARSK